MWQLTKAGFLSLPVPSGLGLAKLTWQVAENNNFPVGAGHQKDHAMMKFLRGRIKHVIYIVKENRTMGCRIPQSPDGQELWVLWRSCTVFPAS